MPQRKTIRYDLGTLDANGEATKMFLSQDFRNAVFTVISDNSAVLTLSFYSSNSETQPDLTSAASATNEYSVTQVINLANGSSIEGGTGLVITSDIIQKVEVNQNGNKWLGAKITARSAWDVTISVFLSDNQ